MKRLLAAIALTLAMLAPASAKPEGYPRQPPPSSGPGGGVADPGANGIMARTASGVSAPRSLTNPDGKLALVNPSGAAGNPGISVGPELLAMVNRCGDLPHCEKVVNSGPDIEIADDFQRALNKLYAPEGTPVAADTTIYLVLPDPGHYQWTQQVVACATDAPPAADSSDAPSCAATTARYPNLVILGGGYPVVYDVSLPFTASDMITKVRRGAFSLGDALDAAHGTVRDGFAARSAAPGPGEVNVQMYGSMTFNLTDLNYSEGDYGPRSLECNGCRGHVSVVHLVDASSAGSYVPNDAVMLIGQDLTADVEVHMNAAHVPTVGNASVQIGGPGPIAVKLRGENVKWYQGIHCGAVGCGNVDVDMEVTDLSTSGLIVDLNRWDQVALHGHIHRINNGTANKPMVSVQSTNATNSPMRYVSFAGLELDCDTTDVSCVQVTNCSASESSVYDFPDTLIRMGDATSNNGGAIWPKISDCAGVTGKIPPTVRVGAGTQLIPIGTTGTAETLFVQDVSPNDSDGWVVHTSGETISVVITDDSAVGSGQCLNLHDRANWIDCTDERSVLRTYGSRVEVDWIEGYLGKAIASGYGARVRPIIGGTSDADTQHRIDSGVTGFENLDAILAAHVLRYATRGTKVQFSLEANAADTAQNLSGTTYQIHVNHELPIDGAAFGLGAQ